VRLCIVNPISQTSPDRWSVPPVLSNRQSITVQMGRHLAAAGADVTVMMADPFRPERADEGVRCLYLPVSRNPLAPPAQIPWMKHLADEVSDGVYDAVVSSELFQWSTLALTFGQRVPPLFVWHEADAFQRFGGGVPARLFYATAGRRIAREAVGFMPRTDAAARFLGSVGVPADKIGPEVPNGIDAEMFRADTASREPRPLVLYVGSLIERKNPTLAVRAMRTVVDSVPGARLLMKGFGDQEPLLRDLARELGLGESVILDTDRSDAEGMAALYNRAWVAVFPSFRDFASLSPIEAVACGVPVVLSRRLFHAEYLERLECGRASGDDADEFGRAVVDMIDRHGPRGLDAAMTAPVVERFALSHGARRMLEYVESGTRSAGEGVEAR